MENCQIIILIIVCKYNYVVVIIYGKICKFKCIFLFGASLCSFLNLKFLTLLRTYIIVLILWTFFFINAYSKHLYYLINFF